MDRAECRLEAREREEPRGIQRIPDDDAQDPCRFCTTQLSRHVPVVDGDGLQHRACGVGRLAPIGLLWLAVAGMPALAAEVERVAIASMPEQAGTYAIGQRIEVDVVFDEAVVVEGAPTLELTVGTKAATAQFDSEGSTEVRLRFGYAVVAGDSDLDGVSIPVQSLAGGTIRDGDGDAADVSLTGLESQSRHRVDGIAPAVKSCTDADASQNACNARIVSRPGRAGTYAIGQRIEVDVFFDDTVVIEWDPSLELGVGAKTVTARVDRARSSGARVRFGYVVVDGDLDDDGISIAANALSDGIEDLAGNPARVALAALGAQADHRVDGVVVPGTVQVISDAGDDNVYSMGDVIELAVTFEEDVQVQGTPLLPILFGEGVDTLKVPRHASLVGQTPRRLRFAYRVQSGDLDDVDGISVRADSLEGGPVEDLAGNRMRTAALPDSDMHKVDGIQPELSSIRITSDPGSDGIYGLGDAITLSVTFSEVAFGEDLDSLGLVLEIGGRSRVARLVDGSGTLTFRFRYTVDEKDRDDDGISVPPRALQCGDPGDCVRDLAGNSLARPVVSIPAQAGHRVDGSAPARIGVEAVTITSDAGTDRTYGLGDAIEVTVEFSDAVHVIGDPVLRLRVGANSRPAAFASGSGTRELAFRYTVQDGDLDDDGISIAADALTGGGIEDADGNQAARSFQALGPQSAHRVDGAAPPRTGVDAVAITSDAGADGTYGLGDRLEVTVTFSDDVHVTGVPVVTLSIGANTRQAAFASGSGTPELTFSYAVQEGDLDEDGISIAADALVGGAIADADGNAAEREFAALPPQPAHRVDGVAPDGIGVEALAITSDAGADRTYRVGDVVEVTVEFSGEVHVTGDPVVTLSVGASSRSAAFAAGSGTLRLALRYTVRSRDVDEDGISIAADALTGGTITDADGRPVDRTSRALAPQDDHRVDALAPTVVAVAFTSDAGAARTYGPGDVVEVTVGFSDVVHLTGDPMMRLNVGATSRQAAFARGSGTRELAFRYTVQYGDADEDGISIAADALTGGTIEDAAGNPADRAFEALGPQPAHRVDAVRETTVDAVRITSDPGPGRTYGPGDEVEVTVEFSDVVHVTGEPVVTLSVGAHSRPAAFASGSGTTRLAFRYTVQAGDLDEDGISIAADALAGGEVEDAGGNPVERSFEALGPQSGHRVDARPATVDAVAVTSDAGEDDTYEPGDVVEATVEFSDVVNVAGAPVLVLSIGANSREAAFAAGSGTRRLAFRYTVQGGDSDEDGISIAADALAGGEIEDADGNPVDRSFEALGPQSAHRVAARAELAFASLTLTVGREEGVDLTESLAQAGIEYVGGFVAQSDDPAVVEARTSDGVLVLTPVTEGTALVTVTARRAPITLFVPVEVTASAEEIAVLESALAAVGRSLLSSAATTIGARLELGASNGSEAGPYASAMAADAHLQSMAAADSWRIGGTGAWSHGPETGSVAQSGAGALGHGRRAMSFSSMGLAAPNGASSWAVWGAADAQTFEGEPASGTYDGSMTSIYLGADARGDGWVAGGSVSRTTADVSYDVTGKAAGSGTLEIDMNAFHPYVQWTPTPRATLWSIVGFGTGDATHRRAGQGDSGELGQLSMRMGLAGLNVGLGEFGGVSLAVRGDAGMAQLETDDGVPAVQGLAAAVQRLRLGVEFSMPFATGDRNVLTPFLDVGGRWDGGDGQTGGGVEVAGGVRYRGPMGGVEVKARSLAAHGAQGVAETGVAATVFVEPGSGAGGLRMSLSPRWGDAESRDVFWRPDYALRRIAHEPREPEWTLDGRVGYGARWREDGLLTPFGEFDLGRRGESRSRVGLSYERDEPLAGSMRIDLFGERLVRTGHQAEGAVLLRLEARR